MARRALRKIDSALDLSRHFHTWESLPETWSPQSWFDREAPLEIEVGSGKGLFLASAAQAMSDRNFLGIEVSHKYARHTAARLASLNACNACLLHGDALRFFRERVPNDSLAAIHVYFPDPWWKARHKKRRVMNAAFLQDVIRALRPGGSLHFWTDVQEYFETTLALIAETVPLVGPLAVAERAAEHELDYRTHFERRMRLGGKPVYRSEFVKPASDVLPAGDA